MRRLLALLALAALAAGCVEPPPPVGCNHRCPICKSDNLACVGGNADDRFQATCVQACEVTADCLGGGRCVEVANQAGTGCVSATVPVPCDGEAPDGGWHGDLGGPRCADATVLLQPYAQVSNRVAGWERIRCQSGCDPGGDGGVSAAHCR